MAIKSHNLISKVKGECIAWNDANYKVKPRVDGKHVTCPFYQKWQSMIDRAYSAKRHEKYPTYIGVTVCESWLTFSNFKAWMELQDWQGKELDKDIIQAGNKHYSPETCCFVSLKVNKILIDSMASRGAYPVGVCLDRGMFKASCNDGSGKYKQLGRYSTPSQAYAAWVNFKLTVIDQAISTLTDQRVVEGLSRHKMLLQSKQGATQ